MPTPRLAHPTPPEVSCRRMRELYDDLVPEWSEQGGEAFLAKFGRERYRQMGRKSALLRAKARIEAELASLGV